MAEPTRLPAGRACDLLPGGRKLVFTPVGESVLVLNVEGAFFALENSCPHAGAALSSGACEGHAITCPAHGLRFSLHNGQCLASPGLAIPTYAVQQEGDDLWLDWVPTPSAG